MNSRLPALLVTTAALTLSVVGSANAQTPQTFGTPANPANTSCSAYTIYIGGNAAHVVPFNGVITSWSLNKTVSGGDVSLKLVRSGTQVTGSSALTPVTSAGLATYPTRIKAVAGDRLAIWQDTDADCRHGQPGESVSFSTGTGTADPPPGTNFSLFGSPIIGSQLVVAATVEPDVNNDGYGDETQSCKVPVVTKLTKAKAQAALIKGGCVLGTVKKKKLRKFTKKQKKNRVRTQSVKAGSLLPRGAVVNITINTKKPKKHKK